MQPTRQCPKSMLATPISHYICCLFQSDVILKTLKVLVTYEIIKLSSWSTVVVKKSTCTCWNGSFTLTETDSDSDSDSKPSGYILLHRTFHIAVTQTRIPTPYFCIGQESESVLESVSDNVNEPKIHFEYFIQIDIELRFIALNLEQTHTRYHTFIKQKRTKSLARCLCSVL